ncbi:MAG: hypothetical protein IEMM0006_0242 [bacterium]|nr:MAG: hypothetical protein IEMM0006_0242 [bacterium]
MEETKHNKAFDELLRSKYRNEKTKPAAHLWKNIQSQLPAAPVPVKPWYLSKAVLIGGSVVAVLGVTSVLLYFIYLKPLRLSSHFVSASKPIPSASPNVKLKSNKTSSTVTLQTSNSKTRTSSVKKKKAGTISTQKKLVAAKTLSSSLGKEKKMVSNEITKTSSLENSQNAGRNVFLITSMKKINFTFPPVIASVAVRPVVFAATEPESIALPAAKKKQQVLTKQKSVKKTRSQKAVNKHRYQAAKSQQNKSAKQQKLKKSFLHPWSIEVFLMPELSSRFVAPNPDYTQGVYTPSYFNSREHYTLNYSYGLLVDYRFLHSLSIETGLSYYVYTVDFSTQGSYLEKTGEHSGVVYTSSGQVGLNINQVDSLDNQAMLNSFSRFDYLSVPFILKYYPFKNLYINAGPTIDYFFRQSNKWKKHDQEGDFNVESGDIEGINRFNISFIFGVGYEQKIWKNFSFSVNPTIRVHLRNLNPYSTVKAYPFNAGFRVSLRYGL